jgi:hypothetical protein
LNRRELAAFATDIDLMEPQTPSSLPEIDKVELVDLRRVEMSIASEYMAKARTAPRWSVAGDEAKLIASLFRELSAGEQMRCHVPPFGFRFFAGGKRVAEASVCWQCNNIFGTIGDQKLSFEFDGSSPVATRLLAEAQRISGITELG